jgi:cholesterol oxidase
VSPEGRISAPFKSIADDLGIADTFRPAPVGVFFGEPAKTVRDPYFGGVGPDRAGCDSPFALTTTLVDGDRHRLAKWVLTKLRHPAALARSLDARGASERSISLLVMQIWTIR